MVPSNGILDSHPYQELTNQSIHVWHASLQQPDDVIRHLDLSLSNDEHERAGRFQFEHLRRSFIVARGVLRSILAGYKNCKPGDIQFEYAKTGKPLLSKQAGPVEFCFNLSHSGDLVVIAVTLGRQIGIDIEHIRPIREMKEIAERTFSQAENQQLETVPEEQKLKAFFNCWTRKEAFIKAIGDGISFPLDQFVVSLTPDEPAKLVSVYGSAQKAAGWSMYDVQPAKEYVAALVVEGDNCSLTHREWTATLSTPVM